MEALCYGLGRAAALGVAFEIEAKLETCVAFDLSGLWAHDLAGRAGAFSKLVAGGMPMAEAVAISGVLSGEAA